MNILFLCHRYPYPPNRGGKIRPFQMIRHLSQKHSVVVASMAHTQEELEEGADLSKHCEMAIGEVLPSSIRWRQAALSVATSTPSSVAYFRSRALERRIQELWKQRKFDVIWVHCAFAAQYAMSLPGSCQRILDFGDIDSAKWEDYSHVRAGPLSVGYKLESQKLRKFEIAAAKKFDKITVTAPGEKETFLGMGTGKSCTVIPNGVDGTYFSSKLTLRTKPRILFLGRMDYFPNIQGIQYFVREVLGLVRKKLPGAELQIVGANPSAAVRRLAKEPAVTVTGFVKDVRPYLEEAGVAIAPLLIARGTQNKILECMAAGVPVVATSLAAKGVQCLPGTHLRTGDTAVEFAGAVLDLLTNPQSSLAMAKVAKEQVERVHSWPSSMKILDEVLGL